MYVIPSALQDYGVIICVDLVYLIGCVYSPNFLCAFSETLTGVAETLVDTDLPFPSYFTIAKIPGTRTGAPHAQESLIYIYCYMDDIISAVQGRLKRQHQFFDSNVCSLKWLFPPFPGDTKDLANL